MNSVALPVSVFSGQKKECVCVCVLLEHYSALVAISGPVLCTFSWMQTHVEELAVIFCCFSRMNTGLP